MYTIYESLRLQEIVGVWVEAIWPGLVILSWVLAMRPITKSALIAGIVLATLGASLLWLSSGLLYVLQAPNDEKYAALLLWLAFDAATAGFYFMATLIPPDTS
jgi:hypothetical protein